MSASTTLEKLATSGVLSLGDGYRTKRSELASSGFRIIRVADVQNGYIDSKDPEFVSREYSPKIGEKRASAGDILLTTKGTVGRVAVVDSNIDDSVYSPQLCWFRVHDSSTLSPGFLRYWLQSDAFLRQASYMQSNTDMAPYISLSDLRSSRIALPHVAIQRAIAEVLGALDDKIAANLRLARTADELQRTKFHSLLADAVQVPLSETAQFVNGKAFTKNASRSGRMVIRIAELNSGPGASTVYNDLEVDEKYLARPGDILFAWSGSLTLHRWSRDEAIVNQHIFKVVPNPDYPAWLVFELIRHKLEEFRAVAADKATTMGHIQRRHLDEPVLVPLQAAIVSYDALMAGLWDRALKANEENLALASLRDTLLPQLMSGKLRVKDVEKVVEEVV